MLVKVYFLLIAVIFAMSEQYPKVPEGKLESHKPWVPRISVPANQEEPGDPECSVSSQCPQDKICLNHQCIGGFNTRCKLINDIPICSCFQGFSGDPYSGCYPIEPIVNTVNQTVRPEKPTSPPTLLPMPSIVCEKSRTHVNGRQACKGQLIFEEDFNNLDTSKWEHDVRIANSPDFEFVAYTADSANSFVQNGILHVKPILTTEVYGENYIKQGNLELNGCTGIPGSADCSKQAQGWDIIPPVLSARLRTRNNFNFCFGKVEIRAKLPAGDWIFPEIWLEPKYNWYGRNYLSGRIQMAMARGNTELYKQEEPQKTIGQRLLEAGCALGLSEESINVQNSRENQNGWCNDFHIYFLEWTPGDLTFKVDGQIIGVITPPPGGFYNLPSFAGSRDIPWASGSNLAPFDKEFYLTLGLGLGGIKDFPDNCFTVLLQGGLHPKPWRNTDPKGMLQFWSDRKNWQQSWTDDNSQLQVDYVKVWAL